MASASFQPHQQAGYAGPQSFPVPQGQLMALQHQLAQLQNLHRHHAGHQYAQQGGAPITVTLPPPPPPHTTHHFGVAHVAADGSIGVSPSQTLLSATQRPTTPQAPDSASSASVPTYAQVAGTPSPETPVLRRQSVVDLTDEDGEVLDAD